MMTTTDSNKKKMFKVLIPVERDGKTFWVRSGVAFENKDQSLNVRLDVLPTNGKLQIRDFDEEDFKPRSSGRPGVTPAAKTDDLPF